MEHLSMSRRERTRLEVFARVKARQINKVKAAALLGLSYRQTLRAYRRYARSGAAGLTHGLRGRASNRGHDPSHRQKVLAAYRQSYGGFGPTLAAEQMAARDALSVDHETLRRWLVSEGLWRGSRKRQQHRSRRERKAHAGELVQLDGSPHDWLEGRGPRMTLIEFVDDATSRAYGRFYPEETTESVMDCLGRYARRHGLPRALYVDKDSIYTVNNRQASGAEILAGKEPRTQFARAMAELGVKIILANSPQAKGRVERVHGTHQDRLVKLMRLVGGSGITTMEQANAYLEEHYWLAYNAKFAVAAAEKADLHRPASTAKSLAMLDAALCVKEARTVGRDWCVCYERRVLQVAAKHQSLALAGRRVEVWAHADGRLALWFNRRELEHRELAAAPADRPVPRPANRPAIRNNKPYKPAADHPYRRGMEARVGVPPGSSDTPQTPAAPHSTNVTVLSS
jgi:hypothetical protein